MTATDPPALQPTSVDEVLQAVREHQRLQIVGAATKTALTAPYEAAVRLQMTGIRGVVDHQPSEFLITALAGTPLDHLNQTLAQHGQYFPFDPPLVAAGATIGGTVAAGLSGPGRLLHGGIRDFVMGVRLVDGTGRLVTGGGRVVKNAAGYDLPKLLVGSCGCFGPMVELTLKVFPQPEREETLQITAEDFDQAVSLQSALVRSPLELTAVDLLPPGRLLLRVSGAATAVDTAIGRIEQLVGRLQPQATIERLSADHDVWRPLLDGSWLEAGDRWVRVPLSSAKLVDVERSLAEAVVGRRYSVAGNLVWIRWPAARPLGQLDERLRYHRLGGTVLVGDASPRRLGIRPSAVVVDRLRQAFDPEGKFAAAA